MFATTFMNDFMLNADMKLRTKEKLNRWEKKSD